MRSTFDRYQAALADLRSNVDAGYPRLRDDDDAYLDGLIAQLKREGYAPCAECGELAKTETDYCAACEPVDLVGMSKTILGVS